MVISPAVEKAVQDMDVRAAICVKRELTRLLEPAIILAENTVEELALVDDGKARPCVVRAKNGLSLTYTPDKTVRYEELVRFRYQKAANGFKFPDDAQVGIQIVAKSRPPCWPGSSTLRKSRTATTS